MWYHTAVACKWVLLVAHSVVTVVNGVVSVV